VARYSLTLGGSLTNLGRAMFERGDPAGAVPLYSEAIRTLAPLYVKDRRVVLVRQFLSITHFNRADTLVKLGQHAESVADWDSAAKLMDSSKATVPRIQCSLALARSKQPDNAIAGIDNLAKAMTMSAPLCFDLARIFALSAAATEDRMKADGYAVRAIEQLRRAVKLGFKDGRTLKTDREFAILQSREDFRELLQELSREK